MNLRLSALPLLILLNFITAVYAADFEQVKLRGPKDSTAHLSGVVYGPIESTDTLWQIATRSRTNSANSIYQIMLAIYELNEGAFENENINLMMDGAMLQLPSQRYISRIDKEQAKQRAELDANRLREPSESEDLSTKQETLSAEALDETKQLLEKKLGAIDEEQTRQFMAIRKQFAESISNVQSILDENQKLFERLEKVNSDIDEIKSKEEQKAQQMETMGESIEELLAKARQEEAERDAQMKASNTSWFDEPINLILSSVLFVFMLLVGVAVWLIKRKGSEPKPDAEDELENLPLDLHAAEMDDLSDALSAELEGDSDDELDDDNLFGDDDILDDVLAEELEESLDDSIDELGDDTLIDDSSDVFDDLGDEVLDDDFEIGSDTLEQEDLDSLFDSDEDLLTEVSDDGIGGDDLLGEIGSTEETESSTDVAENTSSKDEIEDLLEDELLSDIEADLGETPSIEPVDDENEQPEISIDDLLNEPSAVDEGGSLLDESEEINEDILDNLDKEINSQNEELDAVTSSLMDDLEQVEQMDDASGEDGLDGSEETQLGIKTLDELAVSLDDDMLLDSDDTEIDIDDILDQSSNPEPEPEPEPELEPELEAELEPEIEAELEPEVEAELEPEVEAELEPEVEAELEPEAEAELEPEAEAELEPEAEAELEPELEAELEPELEAELEPEVETELEPELETELEPELEAELEPEVEAELEPEVEAELEPEVETELEPEVEAELEPEVEAELEPEAEAELEPEVE
ncbi:MAG: FimV/HubP family polar landmark protein, partial [Paraglaciecola sp.]|uniref:FimV/HubP family polar landmark protein n=1 Tax=Paraglaciecola sp. TaxID=1920173 RepID=UPI0032999D8C